MIEFKECETTGYRARTIENASADLTIAFAMDFESAGERLTKGKCLAQGKHYLPIDLSTPMDHDEYRELHKERVDEILRVIYQTGARTINIAGNSLPTLLRYGFETQHDVDDCIFSYLSHLNSVSQISSIRSGGQTGVDEAGLKAAVRLGIPALCLAPKMWMFRDENGLDRCDEERFKARFI